MWEHSGESDSCYGSNLKLRFCIIIYKSLSNIADPTFILSINLFPGNLLSCPQFLTESTWPAAEPPSPQLLHHATGGGCCVGNLEHWRWHIWLLPHQCHGREDPHAGERPLYPPVCDRRLVGRPHPPHDLHSMEKTLNTPLTRAKHQRDVESWQVTWGYLREFPIWWKPDGQFG